jgi:mono/diheme cytochrome c family protein
MALKICLPALCLLAVLAFAAAPKGDTVRGKVVFENNCAECHQSDSKDETIGPGLKGLKEGKLPDGRKATHDQLLDIINTGPAEMTAFKDVLTEQEKEDVVAFVMTL